MNLLGMFYFIRHCIVTFEDLCDIMAKNREGDTMVPRWLRGFIDAMGHDSIFCKPGGYAAGYTAFDW